MNLRPSDEISAILPGTPGGEISNITTKIGFRKGYKINPLEPAHVLSDRYELPLSLVLNIVEIFNLFQTFYNDLGMPQNLLKKDCSNETELQVKVETCRYKFIHLMCKFIKLNESIPSAWVKFFKWKTASYLCFLIGNEPSPLPKLNYSCDPTDCLFTFKCLLGGVFNDAILRFRSKHKNTQKWGDVLGTLNILKKGFPTVPEEMIQMSLEDTFTVLTTTPKDVPDHDYDLVKHEFLINIPQVCVDLEFNLQIESSNGIKILEQNKRTEVPIGIIDFGKIKILEEATALINDLFGKCSFEAEDFYKDTVPSVSSNYINNRRRLGCIGTFKEDFSQLENLETSLETISDHPYHFEMHDLIDQGTELCTVTSTVSLQYGERGRKENNSLKLNNSMYQQSTGSPITEEEQCTVFDFTRYDESLVKFKNAVYEKTFAEKSIAVPIGLAEPAKVRVITKESPYHMYTLAPFQKWMHSRLRVHPVFELIGKPIEPLEFEEFLGTLQENEEWTSGDYKESTNYINSWLSNHILKEIFRHIRYNSTGQNLPKGFYEGYERIANDALCDHYIESVFLRHKYEIARKGLIQKYGQTDKQKLNRELEAIKVEFYADEGRLVLQKQGQLMGSVISFPILCIANAVLCLMAINADRLQRNQSKLTINSPELRLKINGDDCILPLKKGNEKYWLRVTKNGGLESSIGKTYFSNQIATLNSTLFYKFNNKWNLCKGINYGILYAKPRSCQNMRDGKILLSRLGALSRDLKEQTPDYLWLTVKKRFIQTHYELLTCPNHPAWFLPEWAGGLGIPIDSPEEVSNTDLHVASLVKLYKIQMPTLSSLKEWKLHDLVKREYNLVESHYEIIDGKKVEDSYNEVYSKLILNTFFQKPISALHELGEDESITEQRALNRIGRLRKKVLLNISSSDYDLISIDELKHEQKRLFPLVKARNFKECALKDTDLLNKKEQKEKFERDFMPSKDINELKAKMIFQSIKEMNIDTAFMRFYQNKPVRPEYHEIIKDSIVRVNRFIHTLDTNQKLINWVEEAERNSAWTSAKVF